MPEKMKAVVKAQAGPGLEMTMVDIPTIGLRDVLVKVKAASICGTDLHIYRWDPWAQGRIRPPLIIGHELCGEVMEIGKQVTQVKVGDFISAESHIVCDTCAYCRTGRGHICPNTRIIGVDRDGAFAQYIALPEQNAWINPPTMPVELAVLQENFGNSVHTAFATNVSARKVLVTGCGPVSLMMLAVLKALGVRSIFATDISSYRLGLARTMGADVTLNAAKEDVVSAVHQMTGGEGVDVLLEMSGAASAIRDGFHLLSDGGVAVLLGIPPAPFKFDLANEVIFKGVTVHGITGRRLWETWYQMRGLLNSGTVDLRPVVTHRFPLDDFEEALETMASGNSGKVVLFP